MRTVQAVAWKEIQIYFSSPMAYLVALIFLAVTGFFFVKDLTDPFPEASLSNLFFGASLVIVLLAPALTMRLLAEEQKLGTIELLLTSPVKDWVNIIGKYVSSLVFFLALIGLTIYYPILLFIFGQPDSGPIYSGYFGLILYSGAALAIGILTSTLTNNQIVAFVVAAGILLLLYFADTGTGVVGGAWSNLVTEIGMSSHFNDFEKGVIDTKNIIYFLSLTAFFLFLSIRALEYRRWR